MRGPSVRMSCRSGAGKGAGTADERLQGARGSAGQALPARRKKAGDAPQKASPAFFRERPSGRGAAPGPRGRGGAGGGKKAAGKKVRRVLRGGEGALPKTRKQPPPQWGAAAVRRPALAQDAPRCTALVLAAKGYEIIWV